MELSSKCYNVGIYCRLSKDDGQDESHSIQSQRQIITKYVNEMKWNIVDYYIDDGFSGTSFDRPSFLRLLNDIQNKKINLVITKDLSRLGRNYIQTGYYTEEFFPLHNVRYIAINDNFDTEGNNNEFGPFKNIINEWYAKDVSKKIRFTLDNMKKTGIARKSSIPLFGYAYNDLGERVVDEETSIIVKIIFDEYVKTKSFTKVAEYLKAKKIKIPSYYNAIKYGYNKNSILSLTEEHLTNWTSVMVKRILVNYDYTGAYSCGKTKKTSFKDKKRKKITPIIHENKYEPIIDKTLFNKVNKIATRTRSGKLSISLNKYKGLIYCEHCMKKMKFEVKYNKDKIKLIRYFCSNPECSKKNTIKIQYLDKLLNDEISLLKSILKENKHAVLSFASNYKVENFVQKNNLNKEINLYKKKLSHVERCLAELFEQNLNKMLPDSTYQMLMEKYTKEKELIEGQINSLNIKTINGVKFIDYKKELLNFANNIELLDFNNETKQSIIYSLIDKVYISMEEDLEGKSRSYNININYGILNEILHNLIGI